MRFLFIIFAITLVGCGSTPYRDDYTKHVNIIREGYLDETDFKFNFVENPNVDLRGLYSQNDTANASPIMYQGVGGVAGLLVQIGTHSSLIQSQRNSKLAKDQEHANNQILPLIDITTEVPLRDLIGEHSSQIVSLENVGTDTVNIKPIFFSNSDMTELSVKSIVWLPLEERRNKRKQRFKYKNLIQVYSPKLKDLQSQQLTNGDSEFLLEVLSSLLKTTLYITKNELTGQFSKVRKTAQTFIVEENSSKKVIRGSIVANKCGYQIIQDIHSWFIAYPTPEIVASLNNDFVSLCHDKSIIN